MADYKIKDLETLTGVKAHTIRIWEKRYGFVNPDRTDTQIRTYSDQELTMLLNVAMLNKTGMKISHIAQLNSDEIASKVWEIKSNPNDDLGIEKLILALVEMDEVLFHHTLSDLVKSVGLFNTFLDYLIPFLDRIGVMWLVGSINTAQEHFISHLIRQRVIAETDKLEIPSKTEAPIMLFLPEHEWHEISLLFYQYVLRKKGINTVYLGQSLPFDSLIECIDKIKPKALLTSWLTSVDEKFLINYFKNLGREAKSIKIYAGGYQIGKHSEALKDMVYQVNDVKILTKLFTI
jgi:DNA-binding transcriptional MerR regulator